MKEVCVLNTDPHQAVYKHYHGYLWVLCITVPAPSYPDPNNCCRTQWNTAFPPVGNGGCRAWGMQECLIPKWTEDTAMMCTQTLWCAPGNASVICSLENNCPGSAANSELSVCFVLSSPWIKFENDPEFVTNHSTTAVKLFDFLDNQHTYIDIFLWLYSVQIQLAGWAEVCVCWSVFVIWSHKYKCIGFSFFRLKLA